MAKQSDLFEDLEITSDTPLRLSTAPMIEHEVEDEDLEVEDTEVEDTEVEADEQEANETEDTEDEFSYEPFFQDLVAEGILFDKDAEEGYDDSIEGVRQAFKDARERDVASYIESLPPTAQAIMKLARQGATEDDIQALITLEEGADWESADMSDEDIQAAAVEEAMRLRDPDLSEEDIAEKLEDLKDLGKLEKQAERDQKFLLKHQESQKTAISKQVEARKAEQEAAYEKEITTVKTYLDNSEAIAGYKLTKRDREGFLDFLYKKDKDGKTEAMKASTPERQLQKEFLSYKNFNVGKVERDATTEITKNIKKQLSRYKNSAGGNQPIRVEKEPEGIIGKILLPGRN